MQRLTIGRHQLHELHAGDRIVKLDDHEVDGYTVIDTLHRLFDNRGPYAVGVEVTGRTGTVNLYPDSSIERDVTVERDDPKPPKPVTRTIDGMRLTRIDDTWLTADKRFRLSYGYGGMTECQAPHPVRITRGLAEVARENKDTRWARPILEAIMFGRRGYLCEGGMEHHYENWQIWDTEAHDYAGSRQEGVSFESFTEAAKWLAAYIARK